ncbi:MAG: hypothetical protein ACI8W8_004265 [Rhodothermales bacterium]|jgi:hypothetical protein
MNERFEDLVERHLCDDLSVDEKSELAEFLDSDAGLAHAFVSGCELNSALVSACRDRESLPPSISTLRRPLVLVPWVLAAAACLALIVGQILSSDQPDAPIDPAKPSSLAVLLNQSDARFAYPRAQDTDLGAGGYELLSGVVHLRFASGVDFVLEGPASLEIVDAMNVRLSKGKARILVPPSGHGFTIAAGGVLYEDVGTEFGLLVDSDNGGSLLRVFDGQVNVLSRQSKILIKRVNQGETVAYADGQPTVAAELDEAFLTANEVAYLWWNEWSEAALKDDGLIGFFSFSPDESDAFILKNAINGPVRSGRISGARWVSGRWPGKRALLFDRDTDFVELEVSGDFRALSIAAWVNVDHLEHVLNAVVDSNGWENGDVHLQITRSGEAYADVAKTRIISPNSKVPATVTVGQWTHIAASLSLDNQRVNVYVNGDLSKTDPLKSDGRIRPQAVRLGNWLAAGDFETERSFHGRMDELAIWNRALSQAEIRALVDAGRPNTVWAAGK